MSKVLKKTRNLTGLVLLLIMFEFAINVTASLDLGTDRLCPTITVLTIIRQCVNSLYYSFMIYLLINYSKMTFEYITILNETCGVSTIKSRIIVGMFAVVLFIIYSSQLIISLYADGNCSGAIKL